MSRACIDLVHRAVSARDLVVAFALAGAVVGCASNGSGDDGMGSGSAPPFTNGASTLAGAGDAGSMDGDRDVARFSNPVNVAYGPDGKVYVADFDNNKVRAVDAEGNTTTVVAQMGFARPFGLAFGGSTLYVSTDNAPDGTHTDTSGSIWKVDISAMTATVIVSNLGRARGLIVMSNGQLATTDYQHHVVQLVDPATGIVTPLAGTKGIAGFADGTGTTAQFSQPYGLVQRSDGALVVCDYGNNRLRVVTLAGVVSTLAGSGEAGFVDGTMASAKLNQPEGVAITSDGTMYIADTGNYRVRRIVGSTMDTIAGDGNAGYLDDDNPLSAELYGLEGISVRPDGSLVYVADGNRGNAVPFNRVRQVKPAN